MPLALVGQCVLRRRARGGGGRRRDVYATAAGGRNGLCRPAAEHAGRHVLHEARPTLRACRTDDDVQTVVCAHTHTHVRWFVVHYRLRQTAGNPTHSGTHAQECAHACMCSAHTSDDERFGHVQRATLDHAPAALVGIHRAACNAVIGPQGRRQRFARRGGARASIAHGCTQSLRRGRQTLPSPGHRLVAGSARSRARQRTCTRERGAHNSAAGAPYVRLLHSGSRGIQGEADMYLSVPMSPAALSRTHAHTCAMCRRRRLHEAEAACPRGPIAVSAPPGLTAARTCLHTHVQARSSDAPPRAGHRVAVSNTAAATRSPPQ